MKTYYVNYEDKVILNRDIVLYYKNNKDYCNRIYIDKPNYNSDYTDNTRYTYIIDNILLWDIVQITDLQYEKLINHDCFDCVYYYDNINKFDVYDNRYVTIQKDSFKKFIEFYNFVKKNNLWNLL